MLITKLKTVLQEKKLMSDQGDGMLRLHSSGLQTDNDYIIFNRSVKRSDQRPIIPAN